MCKGTYQLGQLLYRCYCPTCYPLHDVSLMWPLERQWTDNRQGKSRRISLIRSAWHLSRDHELPYRIHTIYCGQRSVAYAAAWNLRLEHPLQTGQGTTQETLSLLD